MLIAIALINLCATGIVSAGFAFMAKSQAKERVFLVNAALARNPAEFAARQQFIDPAPAVDDVEYPEQPVGL